MGSQEDTLRAASELLRVAFVRDAKPPDRDAVHLLDAGRMIVAPRDVIGRRRRQDFHVGMARQMLGDVAGMRLGAAVNCCSVALNDDGELHCSSASNPRSGSSGASGLGAEAAGMEGPPAADSLACDS